MSLRAFVFLDTPIDDQQANRRKQDYEQEMQSAEEATTFGHKNNWSGWSTYYQRMELPSTSQIQRERARNAIIGVEHRSTPHTRALALSQSPSHPASLSHSVPVSLLK